MNMSSVDFITIFAKFTKHGYLEVGFYKMRIVDKYTIALLEECFR